MSERKRLIFTDGLGNPFAMKQYRGCVYALIGPFENFNTDGEFQDELQLLVARHNHKRGHLSDQGLREIENTLSDQPCGECHLQPGERCDICGRRQLS